MLRVGTRSEQKAKTEIKEAVDFEGGRGGVVVSTMQKHFVSCGLFLFLLTKRRFYRAEGTVGRRLRGP